jgi:hypothetical protein
MLKFLALLMVLWMLCDSRTGGIGFGGVLLAVVGMVALLAAAGRKQGI